MQAPLPEVNHELAITIEGETYSCDVNAHAIPLFNYYAVVLTFDMEDQFFEDFELEAIFLNQLYPVETRANALSNLQALTENFDWIIEQAYKAFAEAEWEFMIPQQE